MLRCIHVDLYCLIRNAQRIIGLFEVAPQSNTLTRNIIVDQSYTFLMASLKVVTLRGRFVLCSQFFAFFLCLAVCRVLAVTFYDFEDWNLNNFQIVRTLATYRIGSFLPISS